ncbi:MAG TPA: XRE family transcriptional regulator [Gemmatimonadaceae bacterium]|nr:XRE family transcriptional regulator [Gemmatimonadaceae bacterium]
MDEPDPIPDLKQQLRDDLIALIGKYDQYSAAGAIKADQPRMSDLQRNRLDRFSLETLIRFLTRVECRVEIKVVRLSPAAPRIFRFPARVQTEQSRKD